MAYKQQDYTPQQSVTFHDLQPGVKYRVRVRALDGNGNVGAYSNPVDIIAGLGSSSQASSAVASLTVVGYPLGVKASWNVMTGAQGYEIYMTEGSAPPDPDPSNKAQLVYRGNSNDVIVQATPGNTVKIKVLWYDQFGRMSTGVAAAEAKAQNQDGGLPI